MYVCRLMVVEEVEEVGEMREAFVRVEVWRIVLLQSGQARSVDLERRGGGQWVCRKRGWEWE